MSRFYVISNSDGMRVVLSNYGASIVSIFVKDREGNVRDVVLGFDDINSYASNPSNFGATVGRVCGRIKDAEFELGGITYTLQKNDGNNCLHGGRGGYSSALWDVLTEDLGNDSIIFTYKSEDMQQGFPGTAQLSVQYTVTDKNELLIKYNAVCDKDTLMNLTNHAYFNLDGDAKKKIFDYMLRIDCDKYLETDDGAVPTGKVIPVKDSPFDFTKFKRIGNDIEKLPAGYNHNYVIENNGTLKKAVDVYSPDSGIRLEVETDNCGLQVYSSYYLDGSEKGKGDVELTSSCGICFEAQGYPDAIHHKNFESTVLSAGEVYSKTIIYRFGVVGERYEG